MTAISVKTGVWKLSDIYDKINFGLTYSADDTPIPSGPQAGTMWVWGRNNYARLGLNNQTHYSSPVQLPGTEWTGIAPRGLGSNALKCDNTLWGWGNYAQAAGLNCSVKFSSPVQIPGTSWCSVEQGIYNGYAKKTDSTIWGWGNNSYATVGDDSTVTRSSPIQIPGSWCCIQGGYPGSAGLKTDNTLWVWGKNDKGAFGNGVWTNAVCGSPVQVAGNSWCAFSTNGKNMLGIKTDGTLWSWGYNNSGRLGDNTNISRSSPVQIPGTSWIDVGNGRSSTIARKTDGTLWNWGNYQGAVIQPGLVQCNMDRSSPIQVPGTTWNHFSHNYSDHAMALKTDGTLWGWAFNNYAGSVGNNSTAAIYSPVQIPGTNWIDVEVSLYNTFARKSI